MKTRAYRPEDLPAIKRIFQQQGFEYQLPDIDQPEFLIKEVLVDENDVPVNAVLARQTVELFMLVDRQWSTPRWRWEALKQIHEVMRGKLAALGLYDVHAWLPPEIEKSFGIRRLINKLGWRKQLWPSFSRKLTPSGN